MTNEKRMSQFEAVYAELHDVIPDVVKMHRFNTEDSYSLPGLAHDYRLFCAALDSVVVELPSDTCLRVHSYTAYELKDFCVRAIKSAGVRVEQ